MIKILSIFGTRPEAIKFAPLIHALEKDERFDSRVVVTGQHRAMLDQMLALFEITPHHDLDIMMKDQTLNDILANALLGLSAVIAKEQPDMILVQGDTTTALAGALAGYHARIPVGHVEAGLRTGDIYAPFPEEGNRMFIGRIAALHFSPTEANKKNLLREGIDTKQIHITGNTGLDALKWVVARNKVKGDIHKHLPEVLHPVLASGQRILLVTGHRRENLGEGFAHIAEAFRKVVERYPDVAIVYPMHLNPKVQEPMRAALGNIERIHLIDPLEYHPFVSLMERAHIILTDSGGIQEEGPGLGKPVLVLREKTERPEAVTAGTARLVGTDQAKILAELDALLTDQDYYDKFAAIPNPFGDGKSAPRILDHIADHFSK